VLGHITDRVRVPVIVDADTGYGNARNVQRTVGLFERAGASMIQLEDQTFPKRAALTRCLSKPCAPLPTWTPPARASGRACRCWPT
jgi:2-methylisocitrate lyase-like PEP mutase family enzyme